MLLTRLAATPTPTATYDADQITPGVIGFVVTISIMIITVLLVIDMVRRTRRVRYRDEIRTQLDAEAGAAGDDAPRG